MIKTKFNGITVFCNYEGCNASAKITSIAKINDELFHWYIQTTGYPYTEKSIKELWCPDCLNKHKEKQCESEDIKERIRGGYYNNNSQNFKLDVLKYLGILEHPKAFKLYNLAYNMGNGYHEILGYAEDLLELLL